MPSNLLIAFVNDGCVIPQRFAARVKFCSSQSTKKYLIYRTLMTHALIERAVCGPLSARLRSPLAFRQRGASLCIGLSMTPSSDAAPH
jgi:hypothetical protein